MICGSQVFSPYTSSRPMNEATQNATVDRPRPWWNSMPTGFLDFAGLAGLAAWSARSVAVALPAFGASPARACRKAFDSGRYLIINGTSTMAGRAPTMNIACQPQGSMIRMPSSAVSTAPTW